MKKEYQKPSIKEIELLNEELLAASGEDDDTVDDTPDWGGDLGSRSFD